MANANCIDTPVQPAGQSSQAATPKRANKLSARHELLAVDSMMAGASALIEGTGSADTDITDAIALLDAARNLLRAAIGLPSVLDRCAMMAEAAREEVHHGA